jgi:hypothetical protein
MSYLRGAPRYYDFLGGLIPLRCEGTWESVNQASRGTWSPEAVLSGLCKIGDADLYTTLFT